MKKLILIQNDHPGTGKSALANSIHQYLRMADSQHKQILIVDENAENSANDSTVFDAITLNPDDFFAAIDSAPITICELQTGMGEFFGRFFQQHEIDNLLHEAGIGLTVVLPVTGDAESFESVIEAAEVYSDNAEYAIAHLVTSSYDDDDKIWDTSYAARVMDMFEAVEVHIPETTFQLEIELRSQHIDLAGALSQTNPDETYGGEFTKWFQKVLSQIDGVRQYLFGDDFRATVAQAKPTRRTATKAR